MTRCLTQIFGGEERALSGLLQLIRTPRLDIIRFFTKTAAAVRAQFKTDCFRRRDCRQGRNHVPGGSGARRDAVSPSSQRHFAARRVPLSYALAADFRCNLVQRSVRQLDRRSRGYWHFSLLVRPLPGNSNSAFRPDLADAEQRPSLQDPTPVQSGDCRVPDGCAPDGNAS